MKLDEWIFIRGKENLRKNSLNKYLNSNSLKMQVILLEK
jgi:hypothetical protein